MSNIAMTPAEFKTRWESDEDGGGITYDEIAECAVAWGIASRPKISRIDVIRHAVLKMAKTIDADEFAPSQYNDE